MPTIPNGKIVATYDYHDEDGNLLYQVVRKEPKGFFQQRWENGTWVPSLNGTRRVLYNLPAVVHSEMIYHVEGEKDANTLIKCGLVASTSPGGANGWKSEYAFPYSEKNIIVIPDKDKPGYEYAKSVINSALPITNSIKIVILPDGYKDVTEWVEQGGDINKLPILAQDISILQKYCPDEEPEEEPKPKLIPKEITVRNRKEIEAIKDSNNLIGVAGQYTKLRKMGSKYLGNCPMHEDDSPSFACYPKQQRWHCFGACNKGGDVIALVMAVEGLSFKEAVCKLGGKFDSLEGGDIEFTLVKKSATG